MNNQEKLEQQRQRMINILMASGYTLEFSVNITNSFETAVRLDQVDRIEEKLFLKSQT